MHTLLPYKGYMKSAEALDDFTLYRQLWTVSNILKGQYNQSMLPGMWRGYIFQLVCYGLSCGWVYQQRTGQVSPDTKVIAPYRQIADSAAKPPWVGDKWVHRAHRSHLLRRSFGRYKDEFPGNSSVMPMIWPQLDDSDNRGYRLYIDGMDLYLINKGVWFMPEGLYLNGREVLEE